MGPLAVLVGLLLVPFPPAATDWVRVETPNLIVFGPGEKRTREVTAEFERFREAISNILPGPPIASAVPTIVVVFENETAFNPFRPLFNGKPVKLGGFFTGTESENMIAFPAGGRDDGLRIIFHEYTHLVTSSAARGLPPWISEGLSEFYSTFEIRPDGKQAVLGRVVPGHMELLGATSQWLTLEQLLTVTHDSPLYNEGERRSLFYAQSWALVHMLMTTEGNRSKQLSEYVQLAAGGTPSVEAWRRAFGEADVLKELRNYVRKFTLRGFLYKFAEGIGSQKLEVMKPKPTDVDAVLSLLMRYRNEAEVERQLARAAGAAPTSMLARALLGHKYLQANKDEEGLRLLVEAADDPSDWLTQYYVASGIGWHTSNPGDEAVGVALTAIDRVIAARPQMAHAYALKSRLARGPEAVAHARKARSLAPGRVEYVFLEVHRRVDMRDFPNARATLAPLMTPAFPSEVRERARSLMGQIVRMEEFNAKRSAPPPAASTNRNRTLLPSSSGIQYVFRELKPGEQRLEGVLERIECAGNGAVTLVVRLGTDVQRFTAPQISDVDFLTYREEQGGAISCGERKPPDAVYLTWLPLPAGSPGVTGRPVAVEFLPDKR